MGSSYTLLAEVLTVNMFFAGCTVMMIAIPLLVCGCDYLVKEARKEAAEKKQAEADAAQKEEEELQRHIDRIRSTPGMTDEMKEFQVEWLINMRRNK